MYMQCPPNSLVWSTLSQVTLLQSALSFSFVVNWLPDTLLQNKLSPGYFTSKQTAPSQGGQSTSRGDTLVKCLGWTVCSKVKYPVNGLLQSNLPPRHFTSMMHSMTELNQKLLKACPENTCHGTFTPGKMPMQRLEMHVLQKLCTLPWSTLCF